MLKAGPGPQPGVARYNACVSIVTAHQKKKKKHVNMHNDGSSSILTPRAHIFKLTAKHPGYVIVVQVRNE